MAKSLMPLYIETNILQLINREVPDFLIDLIYVDEHFAVNKSRNH